LLITADEHNGLSLLMRYLGSRYVQHVNYVSRRTGTLWEGRFRSSLIDTERYLLACYRYIELNPVRARMVQRPGDYSWSSYRRHAEGHRDDLIQDHAVYIALGMTESERAMAYRALLGRPLSGELVDEISASVNGGLVLGDERFKDEVERVAARRVRPGRSGRPKKAAMCDAGI